MPAFFLFTSSQLFSLSSSSLVAPQPSRRPRRHTHSSSPPHPQRSSRGDRDSARSTASDPSSDHSKDRLAMMRGDEYHYQQQPRYYRGPRGAPHGLLMAVVLGLVVAGPLFLGDGAVTEAVADLLGPTGLLLLPVALILVIRVLSSDRGAAALAFGGSPDSVHRVGGSPVGVSIALLLIAALLYYRTSLFGGDGGDDE